MATLEKIEFERFPVCRFIGKSVYARCGMVQSGNIFGHLWGISGPVFDQLENLREYATGEVPDIALLTFDKYDETKQLLGYTVGRFMKADTPVPDDLDYFDIPECMMAKVYIKGSFVDACGNACHIASDAIKAQAKYTVDWDKLPFEAEVYLTAPDDREDYIFGYYVPCHEK